MTDKSIHIAIVGGGLIGMMSAYNLVKSGFKVTIFDKSQLGSESTWAGGGILSPLYPWKYADEINWLASYSQQQYKKLAEEIQDLSGCSIEYAQTGLLIDEAELDAGAKNWIKRFEYHFVKPAVDAPCLDNLSPDRQYIHFPQIAQVRNPRLASSLAACLAKLGVTYQINTEVLNIEQCGSDRLSLITNQGNCVVDRVVVAAGAWSARLLSETGVDIQIKPIRGQMLLFKAVPGFLKSILLAKGFYVIPRLDGRILVGSTMEDVGFDKSTTREALENFKEFVYEYIPDLLNFDIEKHWSGLRPASPQGIPVIDQHPVLKNVYINAGHFRNGVVMAPASAKLLHDLITGQGSFINPESYSVLRSKNRQQEKLLADCGNIQ